MVNPAAQNINTFVNFYDKGRIIIYFIFFSSLQHVFAEADIKLTRSKTGCGKKNPYDELDLQEHLSSNDI